MHRLVLNLGLTTFLTFGLLGCASDSTFDAGSVIDLSERGYVNSYLSDDEVPNIQMQKWWEDLNDPVLDQMIAKLLDENLSLKQAKSQIDQAASSVAITRGGSYPTLGLDSGASRSFSENATTSRRVYSNEFDAGLNVSWTLDLFGQIRKERESAFALFQASTLDYEAFVHSYIAMLVQERVAIASLDAHVAAAQDARDNREKFFKLVAARYERGANNITADDVLSAKQALASTEQVFLSYKQQLIEAFYTIDILLGDVPGTHNAESYEGFSLLQSPQKIGHVCMPVDLLDRRPDLRASNLRVQAAQADIDVAIADLYPQLSISGLLGFNSAQASQLIASDALVGSLAGSLSARIFEGGALRANIDLQEAEAQEMIDGYVLDILEALKDVETALFADKTLQKRSEFAQDAAQAQKRVTDMRKARYENGSDSLQDYLDAEYSLAELRHTAIDVQQSYWNNRINLYLALGGDWLGTQENATKCLPKLKLHDFAGAHIQDIQQEEDRS